MSNSIKNLKRLHLFRFDEVTLVTKPLHNTTLVLIKFMKGKEKWTYRSLKGLRLHLRRQLRRCWLSLEEHPNKIRTLNIRCGRIADTHSLMAELRKKTSQFIKLSVQSMIPHH